MNKRLLSVVLVLCMLFSTFTLVQAANTPDFSIEASKWSENNEIELTVSINNNPGIAAFNLFVNFDSVLFKVVSIEKGDKLPGGEIYTNIENIIPGHTDKISAAWFQTENFSENGELFKIKLALTEYASNKNSGETIEFDFDENYDIVNEDLENLNVNLKGTEVTLPEIQGEGEVFVPVELPEEPVVEEKPKVKIVLTIDSVEIKINKNTLINDVAPVIVNDRTMLPVRVIAENMVPVAKVAWDETLQKVTVTSEDDVIEIIIGSNVAYVNGEEKELDSPAFISNDRTYLPVRFISESLKAKVSWNEELQQVTITK